MKKILIAFLFILGNSFHMAVMASSQEDEHSMKKPGYNSWQPLQKGDTVYIIAPSFGLDNRESKLVQIRTELGKYELNTQWNEGAFSHTDPLRPELAMNREAAFNDLMYALKTPHIKAIWALRGGRLSCELWDFLDNKWNDHLTHTFNDFRTKDNASSPDDMFYFLDMPYKNFTPKPIIGFSDTTSLHLWFNLRGFPTIHGPVLAYSKEINPAVNGRMSLKQTIDILKGDTATATYKGLRPINNKVAEDFTELQDLPLIGGNLSSLHYYQSAYFAQSAERPEDIIVIETIDDPTRIDSILYALWKGGFFTNTKAIIFGLLHDTSFKDEKMFQETQKKHMSSIVRLADLMPQMPIFSIMPTSNGATLQFGHGDYNDPLPLGTHATLRKDTQSNDLILEVSAS